MIDLVCLAADKNIEAALTGHLVFSTLHTNDAPSSIARLLDLGLEPFLVTASIEGVVAQRLVRKICNNCKTEYTPSVEQLMELELKPEDVEGKIFYYGKGCEVCNNTGYKGRQGLYEIMMLDDDMKDMIINHASTQMLRMESKKRGMKIFSVHKGYSYQSRILGHLANPKDIEKAALNNPDITFIIYHSALQHGPNAERPCTDGVAQAFTGLVATNQGMDGVPHRTGPVMVADVVTGISAFAAVQAALAEQAASRAAGAAPRRHLLDVSLMQSTAALLALNVAEQGLLGHAPSMPNVPAGTYQGSCGGCLMVSMLREP